MNKSIGKMYGLRLEFPQYLTQIYVDEFVVPSLVPGQCTYLQYFNLFVNLLITFCHIILP